MIWFPPLYTGINSSDLRDSKQPLVNRKWMDGVKFSTERKFLNRQLSAADFRCWQKVLMSSRLTSGRRHQATSAAQAKQWQLSWNRETRLCWVASTSAVRACSFWWSQGIVAPSMLLPQSVDWNSSEEALIPHTQAELQVLLVLLTRSDSAAFHQKWCESCLSMNQMTFPWFWLVTSFDFCSQIWNC